MTSRIGGLPPGETTGIYWITPLTFCSRSAPQLVQRKNSADRDIKTVVEVHVGHVPFTISVLKIIPPPNLPFPNIFFPPIGFLLLAINKNDKEKYQKDN